MSSANSPSFKCSAGNITYYLLDKDSIVWNIKQFHGGGEEHLARAHQVAVLPSISAANIDPNKKSWKAPTHVKIEIQHFTVTGIQMRYLKIMKQSGHQALPWVHYITANVDIN
jgi:AP-1 complex subunit mu